MTLVSVTAYHSFSGEVEASNTPTIRRLTPSCRHQLSPIARHGGSDYRVLLTVLAPTSSASGSMLKQMKSHSEQMPGDTLSMMACSNISVTVVKPSAFASLRSACRFWSGLSSMRTSWVGTSALHYEGKKNAARRRLG